MIYSELVAAAKSYADRQDLEVDESVDIFILMAEARINRVLKTREQSTRATMQAVEDKEYYPLPCDYSGMRDVQVSSADADDNSVSRLSYVSPEYLNSKSKIGDTNQGYYCVVANQLQVYPLISEDCVIEMVYWQNVPNLNSVDNENWLSISHPDIYLAGIVAEIETFAKNYEVAKGWDSRMSRAIGELEQSDVKENWAGSQLVTRVE